MDNETTNADSTDPRDRRDAQGAETSGPGAGTEPDAAPERDAPTEPYAAREPEPDAPTEALTAGQAPPRAGPDAGHEVPPAPPAAPPVPRLLRYPDAGPGAGVAAGIGEYFGIDPVLVRIAFAVLAFAGGAGILLYLLGWALIPEAPAGTFPGQQAPHGYHAAGGQAASRPDATVQWVGAGLVVFAALWLTAQFDFVSPPVLWAMALIVVGVLLFRGDLSNLGRSQSGEAAPPPAEARREPVGAARPGAAPPRQPAAPGAPAAYGAAPQGPARRAPGWDPPSPPPPSGGWQAPAQPPPPAGAWRAPAPLAPRPQSGLGRLTVGAVLLAGGAAALLDNAGVLDLTARHYVSLALLVVGLGLLAGSLWGRARGLIAVGLLLIPVVLLAGVADAFVNVRGGAGERFFVPGEVEEIRGSYELFAGSLNIDLTAVDLAGDHVDVVGSVTFGELVVVVPPDVAVEIDAVVGGGEIQLPAEARNGGFAPGRPVSGLRVERQASLAGDDPAAGSLTLDLRTGFGAVIVRRGP